MCSEYSDLAGLERTGRNYVRLKSDEVGGYRQAMKGLFRKTFPMLLGLGRFSFWNVLSLLIRVTILIGTAIFPIVLRRVFFSSEQGATESIDWIDVFSDWSGSDWLLSLIAVLFLLLPKILDLIQARSSNPKDERCNDFAAAIAQMPPVDGNADGRDVDSGRALDAAIFSTLVSFKRSMEFLVGTNLRPNHVEVALLEFCDGGGENMQVRARTKQSDPTRRPIDSRRLMAYQVALNAKPLIEHDFRGEENPFDDTRVSVLGGLPVPYSSVMFLPLVSSERQTDGTVVDYSIGVLCVHCEHPYSFWRWGDHKRRGCAIGTIAYVKGHPHIALLEKLLQPIGKKVELESI